MDKPKCACFQYILPDSHVSAGEIKALEAGATTGLLFGDVLNEFGVCPDAAYHVFLTAVASMLNGICAEELKSLDTKSAFLLKLDTLTDDLRQRNEETEFQRAEGTAH